MFLRSLTLRGFKSFADKTTLEFTPGTSVIVGPNGSGKSNIVDAIAWVLGEQGPRAMRGGHMSDVIFAGTASRPALGMAEVRMVIDNEAGLIPVPASEIEISRAVFRNGDSEYRLGGRPCRLIDIQELLSDTGMGRAQHTIVGQGELESVLSARPEERRQFIEEAAGIAKHRRRRERAERRLAGLEGDLHRLQDLVGELRRQLKPLKAQAELAQRHDALEAEAADLAQRLAAARLRELLRDRARRAPAWSEAEAAEAAAHARLAEIDAAIAGLEDQRSAAEGRARAAEEALAGAARARSEAEDALRTAIREEASARERLAAAANRSGRLFALEEELERTRAALAEVTEGQARAEEQLAEAEREYRRAEAARRDAEDERRRAEAEAAARRAEADALGRSLAGQEEELARLGPSLESLGARIGELEARSEALGSEIERLDAHETPLAGELAALAKERQGLAASLAELETQEQGLLARRDVAVRHRDELSESRAAAFVRRRDGRPLGVLGELIQAPPDLRIALRAALGSLAEAVVYRRREEAVEDATAPGSLGLSLAVAGGGPVGTAPPALAGERPLLEAVRPDPVVADLARRVLGDVYLAQNLAEASTKQRLHPGTRFVTPEGVVVGPVFVRAAHGHDVRLERARRDVAAIERELASVHRGLRETRQRLGEVTAREQALRGDLDDADRAITAAADEMAADRADLAALRREEQMLRERAAAVRASADAARERLAERSPSGPEPPPLPDAPEPPVHLRVEAESLRRERGRLESGVARASRELEELAAEDPVSLREVLRACEAAREAAESALEAADGEFARARDEGAGAAEELRTVQHRHAEANRSWREEAGRLDALRREHEEETRARLDLDRRIGEAERLVREGHDADPAAAVGALEEGDTVAELARRADTVARRLGLLGKVNLLAVGELEALTERHDFLVRELEDIRTARRDLQEVIAEVDLRIAELFESAFGDVAREFAALFVTMFPGGEGRLVLTDPGDPLGSGVEVEARPGRGRVKRLSLLSGGERSLAALAFLFAIFRARPSPFYLMDEVEAALDDVNLHRFLEVVREFARTSQILVVTHQKRTMETADVLYGVSMGSAGTSAVISQRLVEVTAG